MEEMSKNFKIFNLDVIFVATHVPGQSSYNQVDRRITVLSKDLSGLILPAGYFGSHVDSNEWALDTELELQNFQKANET